MIIPRQQNYLNLHNLVLRHRYPDSHKIINFQRPLVLFHELGTLFS